MKQKIEPRTIPRKLAAGLRASRPDPPQNGHPTLRQRYKEQRRQWELDLEGVMGALESASGGMWRDRDAFRAEAEAPKEAFDG